MKFFNEATGWYFGNDYKLNKFMKSIVKTIIYLMISGLLIKAYARPVKIAISSQPNNLSPFFSTDSNSQNLGRLLHRSLVDFDENMKIICNLCESFNEEFENNKYKVNFKIKKGVRFWDGTPVTAKDVKASISFFTSEKIKSTFRFAFKKIVEIEIKNDYEFKLIFEKFALNLLTDLTLLKIVKKTENEYLGCGDYAIKSQSEFEITLSPVRKKQKVDLEFKVVKDETTLALKLINNEIDMSVSELSPRKVFWLKKRLKGFEFIEKESAIYRYINFNHQRKLLKNRDVRKAIAKLIPVDDIIRYKLKGLGVRSVGFLSSAFKDYYQEGETEEFNKLEAEKILDVAGFKKKENGYRFQLDWISTSNKSILEIVNIMISSLESAGIKVNLVTQEWGTFMKSVKTGAFDIYTSQWIGFVGPDIMNFVFHSENTPPKGANRGFFIREELDKYLDLGSQSVNLKERKRYYSKAQSIINKELGYVNLWHPKLVWIIKNCLSLKNIYPTGSFLAFWDLKSNCK